MMTKSTPKKSRQRNGFSLMEMIIVVSVLAGMAAMTYPMLSSPLSKLRLQAAAQEVSSELAKARLKAMQSGVPQVFRIQMNTGKFQVSAASDDDANDGESKPTAAERMAIETASVSNEEHSPLSEASDMEVDSKELPDGICFECPVTEETPDQDRTEVAQEQDGWTDLAIFYPNGDTTNAIVSLRGDTNLHLDVKLSGFTGTAKIGEAHRQEFR